MLLESFLYNWREFWRKRSEESTRNSCSYTSMTSIHDAYRTLDRSITYLVVEFLWHRLHIIYHSARKSIECRKNLVFLTGEKFVKSVSVFTKFHFMGLRKKGAKAFWLFSWFSSNRRSEHCFDFRRCHPFLLCSIANQDNLLIQLRTMRKSRIHDWVDAFRAIDSVEAIHDESLSFFERTVFWRVL